LNTIAIHNPVYVPPTAPVPTLEQISARPPVILAAGRLSAEKDFTTLIRAFARLDRTDAKLTILGKGPERENLTAEIARLGLGGRVELAGYTAEPWQYYETARLFVCSSRSESFGNTVVEAMAHGLSIVSTACGGPTEILQRGSHGRLTPVGDEIALAIAIDAALTNPSDPASQRQRAGDFSFAERVPVYERLIADVLTERTQGCAGNSQIKLSAKPPTHSGQARCTP